MTHNILTTRGLCKIYGHTVAVDHVNLKSNRDRSMAWLVKMGRARQH